MKTADFTGKLTPNGQITVPPEIASQVPRGEQIQVVLRWGAPEDNDAWRMAGRRRFESAYAFDVPIHQWREAGLNTASTIRVHKLTVLAKDEIVRRLGELAEADRIALSDVLRLAFSLDR